MDFLLTFYNYLTAHWPDLVFAFTSIVTTASILVKLTPSTVDDAFIQKLIDILHFFAINKSK